jgi:putative transposase
MPRTLRQIEAGMIYHVLNRGNGRRMLFSKDADFAAFVKLLAEALQRFEVDLLAYCLMGNHWHLLLRPRTDKALSRMLAWLSVTHARRHHRRYPNPGSGHLYQGRFKSFPVESDEHFLIVVRYIHANPLRAGLVRRAQEWRWSDLARHAGGRAVERSDGKDRERPLPLSPWPVHRPRGWVGLVNEPMPPKQRQAVETSMSRGSPFGSDGWVRRTAQRLGLSSTLRPRGRPRKPLTELNPRYRRALERRQQADKSR